MHTSPPIPLQVQIRALLEAQPFAVLCTQSKGQPYGSVVSFTFGPDLQSLAFATPINTTKYRQLCDCSRVAMVIDSKTSDADSVMQERAITITGEALELPTGPERSKWVRLLEDRHPQIRDFFDQNALFRVDVTEYVYVAQFENVHHWNPQGEQR